ncbi:MAG: DUF4878 domain-containing protein [Bacteroidetes bacterium]|nr:DUF4878 domain-containing protein [Bacteroidota bacterium]MBS1649663.1 DUF4878 domain-containing protein [Bacteroidota bacterium]
MQLKKYLISCLLIISISCNNKKTYTPAENAIDAGREFIDGCLKGNFDKANFYLLHNATNDSIFTKLKEAYQQKNNTEKQQLQTASITILKVEEISANITIITYSNSFSNTTSVLKIIKNNTGWLIDANYTAKGNL